MFVCAVRSPSSLNYWTIVVASVLHCLDAANVHSSPADHLLIDGLITAGVGREGNPARYVNVLPAAAVHRRHTTLPDVNQLKVIGDKLIITADNRIIQAPLRLVSSSNFRSAAVANTHKKELKQAPSYVQLYQPSPVDTRLPHPAPTAAAATVSYSGTVLQQPVSSVRLVQVQPSQLNFQPVTVRPATGLVYVPAAPTAQVVYLQSAQPVQPLPAAYLQSPDAASPVESTFPTVSSTYNEYTTVSSINNNNYNNPTSLSTDQCPPVYEDVCSGVTAGLYRHPHSPTCFVQCDQFGQSFVRQCAPGTSWKQTTSGLDNVHYSSPALFNGCA